MPFDAEDRPPSPLRITPPGHDIFHVEAVGEIETEEGVLLIKRITVHYRLAVPAAQREEAERVHDFHARFCPVARSLKGAIEVRTDLELV